MKTSSWMTSVVEANSEEVVFLDGRFLPSSSVIIPIRERIISLDYGVYAALRVFDGIVECFEAHLRRFQSDCQSLSLYAPFVSGAWVKELLIRNFATKGSWKLFIMAVGQKSQKKGCRVFSHLLMTIQEDNFESVSTISLSISCQPEDFPFEQVKSLKSIIWQKLSDEVVRKGYDDCFLQDSSGYLTETPLGNIFWVDDAGIHTPDPSLPLIYGVSLMIILSVAEQMGEPVSNFWTVFG